MGTPRLLVYAKASLDSRTTYYAEDRVLAPLFGLAYPAGFRVAVEAQFFQGQLAVRRPGGVVSDPTRTLSSTPVRFDMATMAGKPVGAMCAIPQGTTPRDDMGEASAMRSALGWFARGKPVGDSDSLVIWGHGGAWRGVLYHATLRTLPGAFLRRGEMLAQALPQLVAMPVPPPDDRVLQPIELAWALSQSLEGGRLGLIGFQSCLMATLEVAYDVRRHAKWLAAAESFVDYSDWDWAGWIGQFISNGGSTSLDLAAALRDNVVDRNALSMIDLDAIDAVVAALEAFIDTAWSSTTAKASILAANQQCKPLGGRYSGTIDLLEFLDRLQALPGADWALVSAAGTVAVALADALPGSWNSAPRLGIFFPGSLDLAKTIYGFNAGLYDPGPTAASMFITDTRWRPFLDWLWS